MSLRVHESLEAKLREALVPHHLEVINESHQHSVAPGAETHFKVVVVSARFEGLSKIARHQLVYGALGDAMHKKPSQGGIHALAITSRTPAEWEQNPEAHVSPVCASKKA